MQSNELRIGNYLQCANSDNVFQVTSEDIPIIDSGTSKAKPIILTVEWLVKFDLEQINSFSFRFKIGKGNINYFYKSKKIRFNHHEIDLHIKYVHQLQNLYFALTQKEL